MSHRRYRVACIVAIMLTACVSPGGRGGSGLTTDRKVISREEIARRPSDNMYSIVLSLRSEWMRPAIGGSEMGSRLAMASATPTVWVDGRLLGALELLQSFSAENVERARYYSATDAQARFGARAESPVIELTTRGRPPADSRQTR